MLAWGRRLRDCRGDGLAPHRRRRTSRRLARPRGRRVEREQLRRRWGAGEIDVEPGECDQYQVALVLHRLQLLPEVGNDLVVDRH